MTFTTRNRSQLLGTQVINQNTGERIGVVSQIWLDAEPFQVSILSVSEKLVGKVSKTLQLEAIPVLGPDAVLIPETILGETSESNGLMRIVGTEVVTEAGVKLGKIKDFAFRTDTGEILSLTLSNLGIPIVPGLIASTFQMQVEEVISLGGDAILAKSGAEDRLERLSTSLLEQVGLVKPAWLVVAEAPLLPSPSLEDDEDFADEFDDEAEGADGYDYSPPTPVAVVEDEPSAPEPLEEVKPESVNPEPPSTDDAWTIGALADSQVASDIQATAEELGEAVAETTEEIVDQFQDTAEVIGDQVSEATEPVTEVVVEQVDAVAETLEVVAEQVGGANESLGFVTKEDDFEAIEKRVAELVNFEDEPEASTDINAQDEMGTESQEEPPTYSPLDDIDNFDA